MGVRLFWCPRTWHFFEMLFPSFVIFLFCEWLDFELSGLLDGFNPHLALAALIFASVVMILKKLSPLLKQTKDNPSEKSKTNDNTENDNKPEEK